MNYPNAINSPTAKELSRGTIIELAQNVYENALFVQRLVEAFDPEKTYLNEVAERAENAANTAETEADASRGYSQTAAVYAENAQADADRARSYVENIIDIVLPVGSQIANRNVNFNPNNVYLGTSWVRVSGFLYGVADNARVGETGGEETHTLTVNEMPRHRHDLPIKYTIGSVRGLGTWSDECVMPTDGAYSTGFVGGGQAHNNMPPYKATIIWERVS